MRPFLQILLFKKYPEHYQIVYGIQEIGYMDGVVSQSLSNFIYEVRLNPPPPLIMASSRRHLVTKTKCNGFDDISLLYLSVSRTKASRARLR